MCIVYLINVNFSPQFPKNAFPTPMFLKANICSSRSRILNFLFDTVLEPVHCTFGFLARILPRSSLSVFFQIPRIIGVPHRTEQSWSNLHKVFRILAVRNPSLQLHRPLSEQLRCNLHNPFSYLVIDLRFLPRSTNASDPYYSPNTVLALKIWLASTPVPALACCFVEPRTRTPNVQHSLASSTFRPIEYSRFLFTELHIPTRMWRHHACGHNTRTAYKLTAKYALVSFSLRPAEIATPTQSHLCEPKPPPPLFERLSRLSHLFVFRNIRCRAQHLQSKC